jgi:hypothetical protein
MAKLPPIPTRDSGGSFSINNPDDATPIKEMFTLGDGLLIVTEKCTYRLQVADQIDPDRINPSLPHNVQQKLFDHGTSSELLCNTLLLAKVMFRKEFLKMEVDRAMQLTLDALGELVAMHDAVQDFRSAEQAALEKARRFPKQGRSLAIPSAGNVRTHCKTVMQKADHFAGALLSIARLFFTDQRQMNWDDFHELVKASYGENDNFSKVMTLTTPLLKLVRNARDCLEHRNNGVTITDFALQPDGTIIPPTIAIDFRQSSQERCPISWFMEETKKALLNSFEMIVVHLCSKHLQPFAGMPIVVALLPENYRTAWHVRFGYGVYYQDGQFAPIG